MLLRHHDFPNFFRGISGGPLYMRGRPPLILSPLAAYAAYIMPPYSRVLGPALMPPRIRVFWVRPCLFCTIFCNLILDLCVKKRIRFSLRDKRLFEIIEVGITRVDYIYVPFKGWRNESTCIFQWFRCHTSVAIHYSI